MAERISTKLNKSSTVSGRLGLGSRQAREQQSRESTAPNIQTIQLESQMQG